MKNIENVLEIQKIKESIFKYSKTPISKRLINELKPSKDFDFLSGEFAKLKEMIEITSSFGDLPVKSELDMYDEIGYARKGNVFDELTLNLIKSEIQNTVEVIKYSMWIDYDSKYLSNLFVGLKADELLYSKISNAISIENKVKDNASKELAQMMVDIGKKAGKRMLALITDMDRPLGNNIGNSLEVIEAIDVLNGKGPQDLTEICIALAANMLYLAEKGTYEFCESEVKRVIKDGSALETLAKMVKAQGGDNRVIYNPELFEKATYSYNVVADKEGYIHSVDTEGYGSAALILGAGRNTKEDVIDFSAGIILNKKTGDFVKKGELIATLYTNKKESFLESEKRLKSSTTILPEKPAYRPIILGKVE